MARPPCRRTTMQGARTSPPAQYRRGRLYMSAQARAAWLFMLPSLLLLATFVVVPILQAAWMALHDWELADLDPKFIGLKNFVDLVADERFWNALRNTAGLRGRRRPGPDSAGAALRRDPQLPTARAHLLSRSLLPAGAGLFCRRSHHLAFPARSRHRLHRLLLDRARPAARSSGCATPTGR